MESDPTSGGRRSRPFVLLVDREPHRRRCVGMHLRRHGFRVLDAASRTAARRLLAILVPQVLVAHRAVLTDFLARRDAVPLVTYGEDVSHVTRDDVVAAILRLLEMSLH